jgi:DNA modification methylase
MRTTEINFQKLTGGCLYQGDCSIVLKTIPDELVDNVICDPPYGLTSGSSATSGFMGMKWDKGIPPKDVWQEILRVTKKGGYLLAFGGTRTHHRLMVNIEDAGWRLVDVVCWLYGSGFPKSLSIDKALSKSKTEENIISDWNGYGTSLKPAWEPIILAQKPLDGTYANNVLKHNVGALNIDACRVAAKPEEIVTQSGEMEYCNSHDGYKRPGNSMYNTKPKERSGPSNASGRFPANLLLSHHPDCVKVGTKKVKGSGTSKTFHEGYEGESATGFIRGVSHPGNQHADPDGTETIEDWQCVEEGCPIKMLQDQSGILKSGEPTGVKHSTEGFSARMKKTDHLPVTGFGDVGYANRFFKNFEGEQTDDIIYECHEDCPIKRLQDQSGRSISKKGETRKGTSKGNFFHTNQVNCEYNDEGYANRFFKTFDGEQVEEYDCVENCPIRMLDESVPSSGGAKTRDELTPTTHEGPAKFGYSPERHQFNYGDQGGPSRFFYCGKASKKERGEGNVHPTVKPLKLLEYLVKLITPPNPGILLDPFAGSGSTLLACKELGVPFMGIELERDYVEIIKKRLGVADVSGKTSEVESQPEEEKEPEMNEEKEKLLRVAVVGSRDITKLEPIDAILNTLRVFVPRFQVVSGGAKGVDLIAEQWADINDMSKNIFPVKKEDWEKHGKKAGMLRNSKIIENSDVTFAFWDGESSGTLDSITKSQKNGHPLIIFLWKDDNIAKILYENILGQSKGIISSDVSTGLKKLMLSLKEFSI